MSVLFTNEDKASAYIARLLKKKIPFEVRYIDYSPYGLFIGCHPWQIEIVKKGDKCKWNNSFYR